MVCFIFLLLCIDNGLILFRLNKDDKIYIKEELMVLDDYVCIDYFDRVEVKKFYELI